jgi:hypothetical protein
MPQIYDDLPFEIDHVVAEQHGDKTIASNLALACFADNHHKGPNLAGVDPKTRKRTWLFNPRRHRWACHFRWDGPILIGRTARRPRHHRRARHQPGASRSPSSTADCRGSLPASGIRLICRCIHP